MSESEWLKCEDPQRMLQWLLAGDERPGYSERSPSNRKLQMFVVALSLAYHRVFDHRDTQVYAWIDGDGQAPGPSPSRWEIYDLSASEAALRSLDHFTVAGVRPVRWMTPSGLAWGRKRLSMSVACDILRDIIHHPFRPIVIQRAWLTADVVAMAVEVYKTCGKPRKCQACGGALPSRPSWCSPDSPCQGTGWLEGTGHLDIARLSVLADALEEVGADVAILTHLRSPGPHWRGCWAIDALTGGA